MNLMETTMNWLNEDHCQNEVRLQRDGVYALLSWRDFNRTQRAQFSFATAAWMFVLAVGLPVLAIF